MRIDHTWSVAKILCSMEVYDPTRMLVRILTLLDNISLTKRCWCSSPTLFNRQARILQRSSLLLAFFHLQSCIFEEFSWISSQYWMSQVVSSKHSFGWVVDFEGLSGWAWRGSLESRKSLKFNLQNVLLDQPLIIIVTQTGSQKWSLGSAVDFVRYSSCILKGIQVVSSKRSKLYLSCRDPKSVVVWSTRPPDANSKNESVRINFTAK
jgi:hypothetical protein